jgi:TonB family protein
MRLPIITLALLGAIFSGAALAQDAQNTQSAQTGQDAQNAQSAPAAPSAPSTTQAQSESNRKITNKVVPGYPPLARSMKLRGTVKLQALVLASGKVKSIQVKGGNALLVQTAETAVRDWKWEKADHDTTELLQFNFNPD